MPKTDLDIAKMLLTKVTRRATGTTTPRTTSADTRHAPFVRDGAGLGTDPSGAHYFLLDLSSLDGNDILE